MQQIAEEESERCPLLFVFVVWLKKIWMAVWKHVNAAWLSPCWRVDVTGGNTETKLLDSINKKIEYLVSQITHYNATKINHGFTTYETKKTWLNHVNHKLTMVLLP